MRHHNDQYRARLTKATNLREAGVDPFGQPFSPTHTVLEARRLVDAVPEASEAVPQPLGAEVTLAGRLGNVRKAGGKLRFATIYDRSRAEAFDQQRLDGLADLEGADAKKARGLQLKLERGVLGDEAWETVKSLDLADWVGVTGQVGRTQTGEPSLFVSKVAVLGKSLLPPPHQAGASREELGAETKQRQRELDLMMSDQALARFLSRSKIIAEVRRFFQDRAFIEVETPMMHNVLGGAAARPFVTHHNALDADLYLRIAPELYLKRLIVGGLERVFEINRNFRNEGLSPRHNPEFTMIEWYQAYGDHQAMMDLTEALFHQLCDQVLGTRVLQRGDRTIDLGQPFRRISYTDALEEFGGLRADDEAAVTAKVVELGLDPKDFPNYDRLLNEVWEEVVEPHLVQPTFITDQPTWLTPLCRTHADDPDHTLRFELFIDRMEIGNAYSELNDPVLQRQRFAEQLADAEATGDDESGSSGTVDEDYCLALEHGLPVCGGQGIGIDRLVMLLTGAETIRDVILFPALKPREEGTG